MYRVIILAYALAGLPGCGSHTNEPPPPRATPTTIDADGSTTTPTAPPTTANDTPPKPPVAVKNQPQHIRNNMPNRGLKRYQKRIAKQALDHPGAIFLESPTTKRAVALTFDDGPDPVQTPKLLAILKRHAVRATFYLVGERAKRHPKLVRAIANAGHEVAGHGYKHVFLSKLSPQRAWDSHLAPTRDLLFRLTGQKQRHYRPPYGAVTDEQIAFFATQGLATVIWSIDTLDWSPHYNQPSAIKNRVFTHAHPGAIILMHSGRSRRPTAQALPDLIAHLHSKNYQLVTVGELLGF